MPHTWISFFFPTWFAKWGTDKDEAEKRRELKLRNCYGVFSTGETKIREDNTVVLVKYYIYFDGSRYVIMNEQDTWGNDVLNLNLNNLNMVEFTVSDSAPTEEVISEFVTAAYKKIDEADKAINDT